MLLNLSNHPFSQWSDTQQSAAIAQFGTVEDMQFPEIPPEANEDEVCLLAERYYGKIRLADPMAVHIMGEMTFCFMLIPLLQSAGIPCYASTTHRDLIMAQDGMKTARFVFVQFREYGNIS